MSSIVANNFIIYGTNAAGLSSKLNSLKDVLKVIKPKVFMIQETKLSKHNNLKIDNYEIFEKKCDVFFVFNGTAANSLSLASTCQSYHSILCHENSHVENDECGAPEFFSNGTKVQLLKGKDGRITPEGIEEAVLRRTDLHFPKPRAITVTQATELGTVYTPVQLKAIAKIARKHRLKIHMDGARFANAVAQLGVAPKDITWKVGVDILSFG